MIMQRKDLYIAKIEGHGLIECSLSEGTAVLKVTEGARHFESLVVGRHFSEVPFLVSRICGVCPVAHTLAATLAIEDALDLRVDGTSVTLRELMLSTQIVQSHALHVFYLAIEDHLGAGSVLDIKASRPELFQLATDLKSFSDELLDQVAGRNIHPLTIVPGGVTRHPGLSKLIQLQKRISGLVRASNRVFLQLADIGTEATNGKHEWMALKGARGTYLVTSSSAHTSSGRVLAAKTFETSVTEFESCGSSALYSHLDQMSFMVGALPRTVLNLDGLSVTARSSAAKTEWLGLIKRGPLLNLAAQMLEIVHFLEVIATLLDQTLTLPPPKIARARAKVNRTGHAIIEAPRGILYHSYTVDENGTIKHGNIMTPTALNLNNIAENFGRTLRSLRDASVPEKLIRQRLEMLLRAYDPCLTCSVH